MIKTFKSKEAAALFLNERVRRIPTNIRRIARRKLNQLHVVQKIEELFVPPGNKLESLKGDRGGQYSIRINKQWRICFVWCDGHAYDVEIIDYH